MTAKDAVRELREKYEQFAVARDLTDANSNPEILQQLTDVTDDILEACGKLDSTELLSVTSKVPQFYALAANDDALGDAGIATARANAQLMLGRGLTSDPALTGLRDFYVFDLGGGSLE